MTTLVRNNVSVLGDAMNRPMIFGHGYGTSQQMWRLVAPQFIDDHRVVLFDHVGSGNSDLSAYDRGKYDSLHGYADDLLEIMRELDLHDAVFVGHSVSAMIGMLAAQQEPERFGALVLVGASPRYTNDGDYVGGFEPADVEALLDTIDSNFLGFAHTMASVFMGNPDRPELTAELIDSFARTDVTVAQHFGRVTFLSDVRHHLSQVSTPCLILQSADDVVAPVVVGEYLEQQIPGSELAVLDIAGHYAHLSNPQELERQIRRYLS
ncbi:MAG: alpha/beta hydrolase [Microbacteriaceae bacterium]